MSSRQRRSGRSYAVEFALVAVAILAIYLFLTNGGPSVFGEWFAGLMQR